jgi:hypothetical protein
LSSLPLSCCDEGNHTEQVFSITSSQSFNPYLVSPNTDLTKWRLAFD